MANAEHLAILKEGVQRWNAWREENEDVVPYLTGVYLARADLRGANLTRANLAGADLTEADLFGANLQGANLDGANLQGANLYGANLIEANLIGADLTRVDLRGADLTSAELCIAGTLAQVTLDFSLVVDVCRDCPDLFGPASAYEDGDPRRCAVE